MAATKSIIFIIVTISLTFMNSCSINKWAVNRVADMLSSGGGTVFSGDDDPELIAAALPFALKVYESLLQSTPDNTELLLATGRTFIMYANAFVDTPATMLPDENFEQRSKMKMRAKRLYLRGRDYILKALAIRYDQFSSFMVSGPDETVLERMVINDVPYLYWAAAGWMAAFSTDPFDMRLALSRPKALALMERAFELDEAFQKGAIHEFFISYYGALPASLGGSKEKALFHFNRALELSGGLNSGPYVALAGSIAVNEQNVEDFINLLNKALEIDPDSNPENRLANILSMRKARWMLDHIEDYFLLPGDINDNSIDKGSEAQ
ncbi:MAG TPA: hypothetical protein ENI06_11995 [Spirochaetales bacterium]|nr:hypothetical protein [Spirochaetales bacterium]